MESLSAYFRRKNREILLIEDCAGHSARTPEAHSVQEVIEQKFRAGAALKAQHARANWQLTETHWPRAASFKVGPFELSYLYQRADLSVEGASPYDALCARAGLRVKWFNFTSCGMSALAALIIGLGRSRPGSVLAMPPDGYPETRELAAQYGQGLGVVMAEEMVAGEAGPPAPARGGLRVLFLDSGVRRQFRVPDRTRIASADLVVLDTTCFALESGRVGAVLRRAGAAGVPVVLARSHTKLDSLGIEYGRLGSLVIAAPERLAPTARELMDRLAAEIEAALRLFGMAAVPAHLPPFLGTAPWRPAYRTRIARIIGNNRLASRRLARRLRGRWAVSCWHHGLFLTLDPGGNRDEEQARDMARSLADGLRGRDLPARCAGSFGFDFVVFDAFPAADGERFILRMAMADLPSEIVAAVADGTADWAESVQA